jgi:hypothetical protein
MTEDSARTLANVILGAGALCVAYYVLKTPSLRRLAWRLAAIGITSTAPAWLSREVRHAWAESGRRTL